MKKNVLLIILFVVVVVGSILFIKFNSSEKSEVKITLKTLIGPNEESPTWSTYVENIFQNEFFGKNIPSLLENPAGLEIVADEFVNIQDIIITPEYNSWRGNFSPEGLFVNEKGNTVQILATLVGENTKIIPANVEIQAMANSSVTQDRYFNVSGNFGEHIYDWRGRIYGEDGRGDNDEITNDPEKPVDELIFVYGFRDFALSSTELTNEEMYQYLVDGFMKEIPEYNFSVSYSNEDYSVTSNNTISFKINTNN